MWLVRLCLWCLNGCALWCARLALVAAFGAAAVVWAAHRAPVALPAMAVDGIARALDARARDAGLALTLAGADFALRAGGVPTLSLSDMALRGPQGAVLVRLSRAEVAFSRGAALRGRASPVAVTARGLDLHLDRDAEGRITLRLGRAALVEAAPGPAAVLARLEALLDSPALAGLRRVGLEEVTLGVRDAVDGRVIDAAGGTLRLDRTGSALVIDMALGRLGGGAAAASGAGGATVRIAVPGAGMAATGDRPPGPRARLRVGLRGVEPARVAGLAGPTPLGASLSRIAAPVSLDLEGGLGADGRALPLTGRLRVGEGTIALPGERTAFEIAGLGAALRLSADRRHLALDDMTLDGTGARFAGRADLRSDGAGGAITAQLALEDVALDVPRAGQSPLMLRADRLWADARAGGPGGGIEIAALTLERDRARATGRGRVWSDGRVALDLVAARLDIAGALALWPVELAPRTRIWVAQTVSAGAIRDLRLSLRHDLGSPRVAGRVDDIALSLGLRDGAMRVSPRLPPITGVRGQVVLDGERAAFVLAEGQIDPAGAAAPGGPAARPSQDDPGTRPPLDAQAAARATGSAPPELVRVGPGRVWAETGPTATGPLRMVFDVAADVPAALALLRAPLFQPPALPHSAAADTVVVAESDSALPADPAGAAAAGAVPPDGGLLMAPDSVAGRVAVTVDVALPLRRDGPPLPAGRRPDFTVTGTVRDAHSDVLLPGRAVQAARLDLRADQRAVTVSGMARVDSLPVDIRYSRALMAQLDPAPRPVPRGGAAPTVRAPVPPPGRGRLVAAFPLRPADLAALGLSLPPGALRGEGRAQVEVDFAAPGAPAMALEADLRGLAVALPGLGVTKPAAAAGRITATGRLGSSPALARATLDMPGTAVALRLPDGLSGGVRLDRLALGGWLDAQGRFDPAAGGAPARLALTGGRADLRAMPRVARRSGPRIALDLTLDRVTLAEGIALTDLRGALSPDLHGTLDARVNGAAPVRLRLAPGGDGAGPGPGLHLTAADGGAVLRAAAGLAAGVRAGALDLRLVPGDAPGRYRGQLRMAGLELPGGGTAALRAGAADGAPPQGEGMAFDDLRAAFTLTAGRIDLHSASATGTSLGLAVDGAVNLRDGTLALQGVVSPLYFLNRMGAFMTRRGEGLIGLHFTVTGPMDAPEVSANPLSMLTPGPLREMFRSAPASDTASPPEDRE